MLAGCNFTGIPVPHMTNGFRLTADPGGAPVPSGDILAATTLRAAAYTGGQIGLLDVDGNGTVYTSQTATLGTVNVTGAAAAIYDVFVYLDSGVLAVETSAPWVNALTRANALAYVNGVWVKAADKTRRWLGTYRLVGSGTVTDSLRIPGVFNADNRVLRRTYAPGPTVSVSSSSTSYTMTDASFNTTVLNASPTPTPIIMTAALTLTINNPTSGAFSDMLFGISVGPANYPLGAFPNDFSTGYQRVTGVADVPMPFGVTPCNAVWCMPGGTGSMKISATERGSIGNPAGCSLQLSYLR